MISIYCDGSSGSVAGKPVGWAWVIVRNETEVICCGYGGSASGTNNIAELTAAIEGMKALRQLILDKRISTAEARELVSDSQYTLGISSGDFCPAKNIELANSANSLARELALRFRWVRGHSGNLWNERADSLAGRGKREHTSAKVLAKVAIRKFRKKKAVADLTTLADAEAKKKA